MMDDMMDDMDVFKECPYCEASSRELHVETIPYMGTGKNAEFGGCVVCNKCFMRGPWSYNHENAIIAWNNLPRKQEEKESC